MAERGSEHEFVLTRVFDAPRDLVWDAWSDPEHLKHWWGPKGFDLVQASLDFRPGGSFHYCLRAPNGSEMWGKFAYRDIAAPERMVFVVSFSDANGGITRHPMSATWPLEVINTVTLADEGGRTRLTIRGRPINATHEERETFLGAFASMEQGFGGTFSQLDEYLAADREIVITRLFDAPRDLVFGAFTDAKHIGHWWGPMGFSITTDHMDVKPGGTWKFVMHGPDGTDYDCVIEYREISAPDRLIYAHIDEAGTELFKTSAIFADQNGKTHLTFRVRFPSKDARDLAVREHNVIEGGKQTLARLAAELARAVAR